MIEAPTRRNYTLGRKLVWMLAAGLTALQVITAVPALAAQGPATKPSPPTNIQATAGSGQSTVRWAPSDDGGSPITHYTATAQPGGVTCTAMPSPALQCTLSGLQPTTEYTITVTATNSVGTSAPSNAVVFTPVTTAPPPPTTTKRPAIIAIEMTRAAYGRAYSIPVKVTASQAVSGTVTVTSGGKRLGSATLPGSQSASVLVPVPAKLLPPGLHTVTATYGGSPTVAASKVSAKSLRIAKATPKISAKFKKAKIRKKKHARVVVSVTAPGIKKPAGKIAIYQGKKKVATAKLRKGKVTVTLRLFTVGKHKLVVRYLGNANVKAKKHKAMTLKVVK